MTFFDLANSLLLTDRQIQTDLNVAIEIYILSVKMTTISMQIECHSLLEHHEAHFGHTMVIFDQKSSKNTALSDNFWSKMTIVSSLKLIKINFAQIW